MLATQINWKSGGRILSLALLGSITLGAGVGERPFVAHASPNAEQSWLTFEGSSLCRTWTTTQASAQLVVSELPAVATDPATGTLLAQATRNAQSQQFGTTTGALASVQTGNGTTTHCTILWHVASNGRLISDLPNWVPNPTGAWPLADDLHTPKQHERLARQSVPPAKPAAVVQQKVRPTVPAPAPAHPAPQPVQISAPVTGGAPGSWTPVPGHPSYGMSDFAGDPWSSYYGVCTWYAWDRHQNEPLMRLGNAANWPANAAGAGLSVGSTPVAGATVIFEPGVEGAGGGGHAAHVEQVLGGGWFIISEMNFYWNGGGWGRVDWRYAYAAPGVSFIY